MQNFLKAVTPLIKRFFPNFTGSMTIHIRSGEILEVEEFKRTKFKKD